MKYRRLGNTGLKVSCLGFGNGFNSNDPKAKKNTYKCVKLAWKGGVNFFDTSEFYGKNIKILSMRKSPGA